jgi:N-acetyl-gamma-glutamyl-phosphate reductase
MALAPFRGGVLQGRVIIDAKTGTSGAGREPQASMHHPSRAGDFTAYKVLEHRHEPEILQALGEEFQRTHPVVFAPHLIPVSRGIFVTVYAELAREASLGEVEARVRDTYRGSNFVRLRSTPPRLSDVVGTNFCDIGIAVRGRELVVMCAIDNLGKGMAGQAVQNLNRAFGLPEETGLFSGALGPV